MRLMQRWMGLRPVRFGGALLLALVVVTGYMTLFPPAARGVSSTVVISEFRTRGPGGGNDEFIELYNLSSSPVNIGNWKIKGSNGNNPPFVSTRVTINPGITLNPGCHYLLTNSASGGYSGLVPGNQTYTTGITDDGGIALTLPDDTIVDQVGMSANSAFKEGAILAPLTTNLNRSYERKPGGTTGSGTDTDNNANDFQLISPSDPQNLSSTCLGVSSNPAGVGSANPNSVAAGGSTLLTVTVTPGTNPTSTGLTVSGDLTAIGGGFSQGFFDDGT
ncbi:MAG TPA: lamin tail domain-containing protein, partial [Acidobacteriota bacterium]